MDISFLQLPSHICSLLVGVGVDSGQWASHLVPATQTCKVRPQISDVPLFHSPPPLQLSRSPRDGRMSAGDSATCNPHLISTRTIHTMSQRVFIISL